MPPTAWQSLSVRLRALVLAIAVLGAALVTVAALAQGSASTPQTSAAALPGLPRDITGFERWTKLNFKPLPNRGGSAHPGVKQVYVNKKRSVIAPRGKQKFPYPNGTIIVKTASTGDVITLVAIARKKKGFDKAHADWQFVEYTRSGESESFDEIARGQVCYSCHVGAKKTDWVFTRAK